MSGFCYAHGTAEAVAFCVGHVCAAWKWIDCESLGGAEICVCGCAKDGAVGVTLLIVLCTCAEEIGCCCF